MIEQGFSLLSDDDVYLFNEGRHLRLYEHLGSHRVERDGRAGVYFAVWAPDAGAVSVIESWASASSTESAVVHTC